jgi:multicomponent Na+:H+ antiporter subunit E
MLHQLPLVLWLVALWMMLWGAVSWLNVLTGAVIALIVMRVFYLPPVQLSGRFNPGWAVVFILTFLYDVVRGSIDVAWLAVRPNRKPRSAVVAVQLHTKSDLIMLLVSINISLVPGSLVVETDRFRSVLYVHALSVENDDDLRAAKDTVLKAERRIVRVMGSRDEMRLCEAAARERV